MNAATNINNTPAENLTAPAADAATEAGGNATRKIPAFFRRITLVEVALVGALVGCAVLAFRSFGGPTAEAVTDAVADIVE